LPPPPTNLRGGVGPCRVPAPAADPGRPRQRSCQQCGLLLLTGDPGVGKTAALRQRLRLLSLAPLAQRVTAAYHLVGLTAAETAAYIDLQLALDGTPAVTFTPAAVEDIFHLTRGVPRLINRLCQTALLAATAAGSPVVEPRSVKAAAIDCGLA
jgi:hypothetical protein